LPEVGILVNETAGRNWQEDTEAVIEAVLTLLANPVHKALVGGLLQEGEDGLLHEELQC